MMSLHALDRQFEALLQKSPAKAAGPTWSCPIQLTFFGNRGLVKVGGMIDGHPFRSSFMPIGDGTHMLPVKADLRRAIGKEAEDAVTVRLEERIES